MKSALQVTLSEDERRRLLELHEREDRIELHRRFRPGDWYRPHLGGQRQFHQSTSIVRCLFPGNGFGKTTAAGMEVNWWVQHGHPFQAIPRRALIIIWCCETFKQFKILRGQLEAECFERPWTFNKVDHTYTWPAGEFPGSQMFLVSGDSSWTHVQGINPDLVIFDEEPPEALWNEMKMRRRGLRKTRYVFAATATQGMTWMHRDLYLPWLTHHDAAGLTETEAMAEQSHPRLWVWARGGINDNPGADAGDRDWYASQTFNSDAERSVRLGGGFADFTGTPVFDLRALELQKPNLLEGVTGHFVYVPCINADDPRSMVKVEDGRSRRVLLAWTDGGPDARGRVTIFQAPVQGHKYVIGHDSAYGLVTGDFDSAVVLDRETGEEVAEANGHWGDAQWAEVLWALAWHYNHAFLLGERQVGLMVMRRLWDEMGYSWQYRRRDETKTDRRQSDELGHHRMSGDLVIPRLRRTIGCRDLLGRLLPAEITLRGPELHRQLVKFQFRPKKVTESIHEAHDAGLEYGAPKGEHDDLCFVAGTMIRMADGSEKPIEAVRTGELVLTSAGASRVLAAGKTRHQTPVIQMRMSNGRCLTGTGNHPVFARHVGWVRLDTLAYGVILQSCGSITLPGARMSSCSTGSSSTAIPSPRGCVTSGTSTLTPATFGPAWAHCTGRSGNRFTGLFRRTTTFITRMRTHSTTPSRIWSWSRGRSTRVGTLPASGLRLRNARRTWCGWARSGSSTAAPSVGQCTGVWASRTPSTCTPFSSTTNAPSAASPIETAGARSPGFARPLAQRLIGGPAASMMRPDAASSAAKSSSATDTARLEVAPGNAVFVLGSSRLAELQDVYNLEVEGAHDYFANGVLVHNCMALAYSVMALNEVSRFVEEEISYPEGSYGAVFKLNEILNPKPKKKAVFGDD